MRSHSRRRSRTISRFIRSACSRTPGCWRRCCATAACVLSPAAPIRTCSWSTCARRKSRPRMPRRRRRRCLSCRKRFTTYETAELRLPQIVKQNGTRADFDVSRIRNGFQRALHKRPVPTEYVDQAVERIVQQILGLGEREIPSRQIGEMVMQELYKLDKVGYIRFASVYRSFQDAADFRDALKEVEPVSPRRKSR